MLVLKALLIGLAFYLIIRPQIVIILFRLIVTLLKLFGIVIFMSLLQIFILVDKIWQKLFIK